MTRIWMLGFLFIFISPLRAQDPALEAVYYDDERGAVVIPTSFYSDNDSIYVYGFSEDRLENLYRFNHGTWLFDANSDETIELIIRFGQTGATTFAHIFVDQNSDATVNYVIEENNLIVTEGATSIFPSETLPSVTMTVQGDWYLPNGLLNWNIQITTDGQNIYKYLPYRIELIGIITSVWDRYFSLDGNVDTIWEFHDTDLDGIPEYGLWRLMAEVPRTSGAARSWLWVNKGINSPSILPNPTFWMYLYPKDVLLETLPVVDTTLLAPTANLPSGSNYFDQQIFFEMDWESAKFSPPIFQGYPIEDGFHVHTLQRLEKGISNYVNFENIQAYYDLAQDVDGAPELHIRHRYYEAGDFFGGNLAEPVNEIRWSWNQWNTNEGGWHYKIGLAGRHAVDQMVSLPDFSFYGIDRDILPEWVSQREWDQATFIATEGVNYLSTEGIYQWGPVESLLNADEGISDNLQMSRYLAGEIEGNPRTSFSSIQPGLRGEFAPELFAQPWLYFSPIDRKLHLKGAEYCIWQLDNERSIRCNNLDGDPYLDHWQYINGDETSNFYLTDDYLLLEQANQVVIRAAQVSPVLFETLPPRDHEEWTTLQTQLTTHQRNFAAGDFAALLNQFEGQEQILEGAAIQDFRHIPKGFRFTLQFDRPFLSIVQIFDSEMLVSTSSSYSVIYQNGSWEVEEASPPHLIWSNFKLDAAVVEQGRPVDINVMVNNTSNTDHRGIRYTLTATQGDVSLQIIESELNVLSGENVRISSVWVPEQAGVWEIDLSTEQTSMVMQVEVALRSIDVRNLLSLDGVLPLGGLPILLGLMGLAIAAVGLFIFIVRTLKKPD